jgi:hypothetical protein
MAVIKAETWTLKELVTVVFDESTRLLPTLLLPLDILSSCTSEVLSWTYILDGKMECKNEFPRILIR